MEKYQSFRQYPLNTECRICLQHVVHGICLFSDDEDSKGILDKIYSCFQLILTQDDYLPTLICRICVAELESANNFRLKCVTFGERFKKLYKTCEAMESPDDDDDENKSLECNESCIEPDHQVKESDGFKCETCDKTLKSKESLAKHIISMHEKRKNIGKITGSGANRRYHCTVCTYSTPYGQTLVNHMRRHDGDRPYQCQCGKSFTQMSSLAAHQKTHSNTMQYTCAICGKQFKHSFSLKNHLRVHDAGKFTCNICFKTLKSPQTLQAHMNRHYNVRNYNCEDCGATFVTSSELINHKTKHKEAKVECHLCGYKTYAKKNLIIHMKRHTGERPFKCKLCDKSEYTQSALRRHHRVHSHEKPYPCPVCSQRFSHSSSLNHHARKLHGLTYRWSDSKAIQVKKEIYDKKNILDG